MWQNTGGRRGRGFTLTEVVLVVAIMAILTTVAVPAYTDYVSRGKISEATGTLAATRIRMEQYFQDNRTYANSEDKCGITLPTGRYFTYSCAITASGQGYTLTATGGVTGSDASMKGFTYTVNQNDLRATTSVPTGPEGKSLGWSTRDSCWVLKKPGLC